MDTSDVQDLLADLGENLDDLESSLAPLLNTSLSTSTSKLPLLDKAKLYVVATYAIESLLFSLLKLNGTDVAHHSISQELTRVKSYFQKVKEAEQGPAQAAQRTATLDKDVAARFIKHGLSGNKKYDLARQEKIAAERAGAKRKAEELESSAQWGSQNRFAGAAKRMKADEPMVTVARANNDNEDDNEEEDAAVSQPSLREPTKEEKKAAKHKRRMERKLAKQSPEHDAVSTKPDESFGAAAAAAVSVEIAQKKNKKAPRSNYEVFQALLQDGNAQDETREKRKKK